MLKNSFDSEDSSNRIVVPKLVNTTDINPNNPVNDILPVGSLGRMLARRNELKDKVFTPDKEDINVRSFLSSPVDSDWKALKSSDVLKKLVG